MEKEKIETCLSSNADFLSEFVLCERRFTNYEQFGHTLPDEIDAEASNMYRRVLCILLYMISKKNIFAGFSFSFEKTEFVAFNPTSYCFYHETDDAYVESMEKFLSAYGWRFPGGWNIEYFAGNEVDDEDFAEVFYQKEGVDYKDEFYGFPITLHNNLFDEVYHLKIDTQKYSKEERETAAAEYDTIWAAVQAVAFESICNYKTMIDIYFQDGKVYFTMLVSDCMDIYEIVHEVNFHRFLDPSLLFRVPRLDKMMKDYLNKWGNEET